MVVHVPVVGSYVRVLVYDGYDSHMRCFERRNFFGPVLLHLKKQFVDIKEVRLQNARVSWLLMKLMSWPTYLAFLCHQFFSKLSILGKFEYVFVVCFLHTSVFCEHHMILKEKNLRNKRFSQASVDDVVVTFKFMRSIIDWGDGMCHTLISYVIWCSDFFSLLFCASVATSNMWCFEG